MSVVDNILQAISAIWHGIFGSSKLKLYEEVCLSAWSAMLSIEMQKKLKLQLGKFDLIQRQSFGLKSVFYDVRDSEYVTWCEEELFLVREPNLKVFSGILVGQEDDIQVKIKFKIFLHRGRLSSLEFESTPTLMKKISSLDVNKPKLLFDF